MITIATASSKDIDDVTAIHLEALTSDVSDFTALGPTVVSTFYKNVVARNIGALLIARDEGVLAGFVLIAIDVGELFSDALLQGPRDIFKLLVNSRPTSLLKVAIDKFMSRTASLPRVPELVYLAVAAPHQGRGIGRALTQAADAWFAEQGVDNFTLNVHADNLPALRLYGDIAMVPTREYIKAGRRMFTLRKAKW